MEYRLSPSNLNLMQDCPRCFWLTMVKKIKRPSGPMSSIPIKMDSIIKNYFCIHDITILHRVLQKNIKYILQYYIEVL